MTFLLLRTSVYSFSPLLSNHSIRRKLKVISFPSNNHFGLLYRELRKTEKYADGRKPRASLFLQFKGFPLRPAVGEKTPFPEMLLLLPKVPAWRVAILIRRQEVSCSNVRSRTKIRHYFTYFLHRNSIIIPQKRYGRSRSHGFQFVIYYALLHSTLYNIKYGKRR